MTDLAEIEALAARLQKMALGPHSTLIEAAGLAQAATALRAMLAQIAAKDAEIAALREVLEKIESLGSDGEHSGDRHARCRGMARAALQVQP